MTEKGRKTMWILTGGMTALLLLVMFVTHRAIPFMMDDLWYSTMLSDDTPISSISDIVKSQIWHYNNWGGRSMTHSILQLTLLAGELAADAVFGDYVRMGGSPFCYLTLTTMKEPQKEERLAFLELLAGEKFQCNVVFRYGTSSWRYGVDSDYDIRDYN